MAFIVADRVKETTLTSGTGTIVLNGAFSGFQTFANGIGNGNSTYYVIENKTNWEVGIGTYSSGTNSLSRDTVLRSSAGGAKISLTGVSNVFCSYPATKSVHANPEDFINVVAYSGVKFADATITNSGAYFNNVTSSGSLTLQPQTQGTVPLNIVRTSSGVFFHAYKDDAYDRPVTLYTNGNLSPEWRLGLKSTPNNVYEAPSFGYVYGEDGKVGLFGNNATKLDLLNTSGLYVTHQSNVALKVASNTGVYVNSLGNAYPALSVNGGPALSAPILSLNNYAGSVLTVVDPQGRVGVKTASPAYDLDVNGSGRFNVVHTTSGISFKDGTFQDSAGKTYSAGSGLVLVDTTFHAISTVTSGDIAALVASGIAISGWNKGYTDASVAAVSGWTGTEYVSLHGTYNNPSWLNSISVTKLSGVVDSSNLPSYVDDVLEYSTSGNFPVTGETGKIYVSTDNNRSYRWSGSAYFQLTDTTALWGEITGNIANQTDLTAYVSSVSGWNKSYTDASVAAASGWNKGYTDNSAVAVSGWNKNYTDSQLLAASGYSSGNYVPYIGATQNVDLGSRTLSAGNGTFTGTVTAPTITGSSNLIYVAQNQTFSWDYDTTNTNPALRFTWGGAATTLWGSSGAVNISIQGVNGFRVAPGQTNIASTLGIGSVSSPTVFLRSDSSNTLDIRNSTNAQRFNLYGTYTDASNYRRLYLSSTTAGAFTLGVEGAGTGASGNTLRIPNRLGIGVNTPASFRWLDIVDSEATGNGVFASITNTSTDYYSSSGWIMRVGVSNVGGNISAFGSSIPQYGVTSGLNFSTSTATDNIAFRTGSALINGTGTAARFFISSGGNIGINTQSPTSIFHLVGLSQTGLTASTEFSEVNFDLSSTKTFAAGNITTQRAFRIQAPTYSFASASTITTASTLSISGRPISGTNATITDGYALNVESGNTILNGDLIVGVFGATTSRISFNRGVSSTYDMIQSYPEAIIFRRVVGGVATGFAKLEYALNEFGSYTGGLMLSVGGLSWNSGNAGNGQDIPNLCVMRDAADILAQRRSTNSQTLRIYNTFTDASNYIRQSLSFTTYSSTVHAQLGAEGAGTGAVNIPFVITPRGTGAFILGPMPDGTTTGGNARGQYAVDLQTTRSAASQIASDYGVAIGTQCTVSGGTGSVAIGRNVSVSDSLGGAVGIGRNVTVTGYRSIGIGSGATTGADSVAIGTAANAANNNAICIGTFTASRWDGHVFWNANSLINASPPEYINTISGAGVQNAIKIFRTVNNTPALIESSIVTSFIGSRLRHKGALIFAKAVVVAIRSDGAINKYERRIAIKDLASVDGSTSTMSVLSSETIGTDILEMPHLNIAITAVSKSLRITVTGEQEYAVTGNSTTNIITATGHPFANDDIVVFNSLTGGSGLTTNPNGQYYFGIYKVINVSGNTFQLAATGSGSTPIDFTTDITAGTICRPILWYTNPIEFFVAAGAY